MCFSLLLVSHRREQHISDRRDGCLEAQVNAVIYRLGANDSAFLGEQFEASEGSRCLIILNGFQVLGVDDDVAWNVIGGLSLEPDDLVDDHVLVSRNGFVFDRLNHGDVLLSASDEDLSFHQFDQTLHAKFSQNFELTWMRRFLISSL